MSALEDLSALISGNSRVIIIADRDVNLKEAVGENRLFLLKMPEGTLASGGRGGGFGERRVVRVVEFKYSDGSFEKLFDTVDEGRVAQFEIPYYVARMPLTLADGTETMGYGVVERELVDQFVAKTK